MDARFNLQLYRGEYMVLPNICSLINPNAMNTYHQYFTIELMCFALSEVVRHVSGCNFIPECLKALP